MPLLSALDDVLNRTLSAIPGLLAKVDYVSRLKVEGRYAHWGLSRVYGERSAQRSLAEAHKMLVSHVLQSPLELLVQDSEAACAAAGRETPVFLQELLKRNTELLPAAKAAQATSLHFNSVLCALSALTRAQRNAIHPGA